MKSSVRQPQRCPAERCWGDLLTQSRGPCHRSASSQRQHTWKFAWFHLQRLWRYPLSDYLNIKQLCWQTLVHWFPHRSSFFICSIETPPGGPFNKRKKKPIRKRNIYQKVHRESVIVQQLFDETIREGERPQILPATKGEWAIPPLELSPSLSLSSLSLILWGMMESSLWNGGEFPETGKGVPTNKWYGRTAGLIP